jgi:5-methylcytosine-specific restriction endonuclease McrA
MSSAKVLRLDASGQPLEWLHWQDAVTAYALGRIRWTYGEPVMQIRGGISATSRVQSVVDVHGVIAYGRRESRAHAPIPPLTNRALFRRDGNLCLYCGRSCRDRELTRDHILPLSRGGLDAWSNVVAACRACNSLKGGYLLADSGMELLAVPYVPNRAEYLALINSRRILADQMQFLAAGFSKNWRGTSLFSEED